MTDVSADSRWALSTGTSARRAPGPADRTIGGLLRLPPPAQRTRPERGPPPSDRPERNPRAEPESLASGVAAGGLSLDYRGWRCRAVLVLAARCAGSTTPSGYPRHIRHRPALRHCPVPRDVAAAPGAASAGARKLAGSGAIQPARSGRRVVSRSPHPPQPRRDLPHSVSESVRSADRGHRSGPSARRCHLRCPAPSRRCAASRTPARPGDNAPIPRTPRIPVRRFRIRQAHRPWIEAVSAVLGAEGELKERMLADALERALVTGPSPTPIGASSASPGDRVPEFQVRIGGPGPSRLLDGSGRAPHNADSRR